jgi:hypothetical protein
VCNAIFPKAAIAFLAGSSLTGLAVKGLTCSYPLSEGFQCHNFLVQISVGSLLPQTFKITAMLQCIKQSWRVFENRVLRIISGSMKKEVRGCWRKLHHEELHNLYCRQILLG